MKSMNHFADSVWSRFFDFVFPYERDLTRKQIEAELMQSGVDMRPSLAKLGRVLNQAHRSHEARKSLESARKKRSSLLAKLIGIQAPSGSVIRETLKGMITERLAGSQQAVYARKLESAASDDDLRSLLEDISRLEAFSEDSEDGES